MKKFVKAAAAGAGALLLGFAAPAHAIPSISFIIDGDTFNLPFSVTNNSSGGEKITRFQLDLSTAAGNLCFDSVQGGPCNFNPQNATPFQSLGGSNVTTGLIGSDAANNPADGTKLLDISFSNFDAGETFSWLIDVDDANTFSVFGDDMIGATALIDFDDGQRLTGILAAVAGNSDASAFTATGLAPTPSVPEPSALVLLSFGMMSLGFAARRRKRA